MSKTKKNYNNKGGKIIAAGGYGCVFRPMLKCAGKSSRDPNKISKLMTEKHAIQEYDKINKIKEKLINIPNYKDYFLVYDATLCRPAKLTSHDLGSFNKKCTALPKKNITKKNINSKLNQIMALNIPNGGLPIDDYIYENGSYQKIYNVHVHLMKLLKHGIIPMNRHHIYHSDIKDSNVLIDQSGKTKLIDWGLTVEYKPDPTVTFPVNWRNRPLQFNVPFSVIIFTDTFYTKYTKYLKDGGKVNHSDLKPFMINYLTIWMKERGNGHYKFINEIMYMLYSNELTDVSNKNKPAIIETDVTIPIIVNYIVDVLVHYTKFKEDGTLNLREYLNSVYIKIVDIWGFINIYFPLLELLSNNYSSLKENDFKIFTHLKFIFNEYLYKPRHTPIELNYLFQDLNILGNLIHKIKTHNYTIKQPSLTKTKIMTSSKITKSSIFKRKKLIKKFKNPILLTMK